MENTELQLAEAFIEQTDRHLFLTGKAGTGKTTFLRRLRGSSPKRLVVTAPTGVAAVNARGVTLHSFFQLPFGPLIEGRDPQGERRGFSKAKRRLIESLDLLVIDEISMVRADVLDGVDEVLRRLRHSRRPFGGVQLLMIGDLGQLAPIVRDEEQEILSRHYDSPFFFSSRALQATDWLTIELRHIYRQSDPRFVELLNRVREGDLDDSSLRLLESLQKPGFEPPEDEGWIILSTHNRRVDAHNRDRLARLPGEAKKLTATIEGTFSPSSCQAPEELELKVGAQVVFLRNDTARPPRYFNGKVAVVTGLSSEEIRLRCPGESKDIPLQRATWEHMSYRLDEKSGKIREHVLGSLRQFPLRPAWAMTIHKSQGLTFERAVIDAGRAFAPGQVYVALSRCKTLDGLVLLSSISPGSIRIDPTVRRFLDANRSADRPLAESLEPARLEFRWRILDETFDFDELGKRAEQLLRRIGSAGPLLRISGERISDAALLVHAVAAAKKRVFAVSRAFRRQLATYAAQGLDPVEDPRVGERIAKATAYFGDKLRTDVAPLTELRLMTDNQEIQERVTTSLESLQATYAKAQAGLDACAQGYDPARVVRARAETSKQGRPSRRRSAVEVPADAPHRELVERILKWRAERAGSLGVAPTAVIHQRIAFAVAAELPANHQALKRIHGVGPATLKRHGEDLLELVATYRSEVGPGEDVPAREDAHTASGVQPKT